MGLRLQSGGLKGSMSLVKKVKNEFFFFWCYMRSFRLRCRLKKVGKGCYFHPSNKFWGANEIIVGDNVRFTGEGRFFGGGGLRVGNNCSIGRNCTILTTSHNYKNAKSLPYDDVKNVRPVVLGDNVWVGINVTIGPGVTVGDGAIVSYGSVVTKSIPPMAIVGGNPAAIISERDSEHYSRLVNVNKFYSHR